MHTLWDEIPATLSTILMIAIHFPFPSQCIHSNVCSSLSPRTRIAFSRRPSALCLLSCVGHNPILCFSCEAFMFVVPLARACRVRNSSETSFTMCVAVLSFSDIQHSEEPFAADRASQACSCLCCSCFLAVFHFTIYLTNHSHVVCLKRVVCSMTFRLPVFPIICFNCGSIHLASSQQCDRFQLLR